MTGNSKDKVAGRLLMALSILLASLVIIVGVGLVIKSYPIIKSNSFYSLIFSEEWKPMKGKFGMLPFISSTIWVTGLALLFAVPTCLLASIYLSEYAKRKVLQIVNPLIDILAGIPSVIYGVWGIIFVVPIIRDYIAPVIGVSSTGYTILTGSLVLSLMIIPVIIHILNEVMKAVPVELREASLSLGASKWQTIKFVVLRKALPGIIAGVILGLSRAFGETMAVLMVVGNVVKIPQSVLDPGYPLPALIANNYGEMLSIPMYDSALMFSALILFAIVIIFNILSRLILVRVENRISA
jgi:phosphate transport system permease protein